MNTETFSRQVGGDHYLSLKIMPIEFAIKNRWDACAFSTLKYLTRWRAKDGLKDLEKGRHFAEMRMQFALPARSSDLRVTSMGLYVLENNIPPQDHAAFFHLEDAVYGWGTKPDERLIDELDRMIARLKAERAEIRDIHG